jgi:hypothetical protein
VAPIEEHEGYDASIPTPDVVVTDEANPNPEDGSLDDTPPAGYQFAEGAVDEGGNALDSNGDILPIHKGVS